MEANPVIAAIKNPEGLETCRTCKEIKVVFILYGDICSINQIVEKVHHFTTFMNIALFAEPSVSTPL